MLVQALQIGDGQPDLLPRQERAKRRHRPTWATGVMNRLAAALGDDPKPAYGRAAVNRRGKTMGKIVKIRCGMRRQCRRTAAPGILAMAAGAVHFEQDRAASDRPGILMGIEWIAIGRKRGVGLHQFRPTAIALLGHPFKKGRPGILVRRVQMSHIGRLIRRPNGLRERLRTRAIQPQQADKQNGNSGCGAVW